MQPYKVTIKLKTATGKMAIFEKVLYGKDRKDVISWAARYYKVALSSIRASKLKTKKQPGLNHEARSIT